MPWEAQAAILTPLPYSPGPGKAFPHLNWTPTPLWKLTGEHTTGGKTPGREAEESFLAGRTHLHPVHMNQARGKKGGLGPSKTSQRSMDREHQFTVNHVGWAEWWTKPSGGPWLRRGSATACHMVGQSPAHIQAQPAQFGPGLVDR